MTETDTVQCTVDMMGPDFKSRLPIFKKINAMRGDVLKADWKPDKFFVIKKDNTRVDYVSVSKMKANLAPIFFKHGVDYVLDFGEPMRTEGAGSHFIVKLKATLVDIETGAWCTDTVYGESADLNDKAVGKANSYAMKQWLSNRFLISDGLDPDNLASEDVPEFVKKPKNKTKAEEEEARSKVLEKGVKPPEKKPQEEQTAPSEPEAAPSEEEVQEPEPEADGGESSEPMSVEKATAHLADILNPPQAKTVVNTLTKARAKMEKGDLSKERYMEIEKAAMAINGPEKGMDFIHAYRSEFR